MNLHEFLAMGGYAFYVWTAYAVFFVVLLADALAPAWRRRRLLRELRGRMARQRARGERRGEQAHGRDAGPVDAAAPAPEQDPENGLR